MVQATILFNCQRHLLNGVLQLPFKEQLHFPAKPNYKVLKRSSMCRRRDYIGFCRWTLARKFQPPYMRHCFSPRANYVNGFKVQWRCILIGVEAWLENENVAGGRTHIRPVPGVMLISWTDGRIPASRKCRGLWTTRVLAHATIAVNSVKIHVGCVNMVPSLFCSSASILCSPLFSFFLSCLEFPLFSPPA